MEKPDESDFYDVADQNKNWDLADETLKNLDTPTFEDYTGSTAVPSATDAIDQIKSKGKLGTLLSNIKAAFKGACLIGHIVNNCVTDNAGLPLSAAQGKVLKDLYTQLYSDLNTTNNNLSNAGIPTVKKITDLYAIKKSGFYYYDAGATNAPMSSRGGMIVANYLSDSWISLTVVSYASSKIYTNTKYNNTWVGWAESATKDDLTKSIDFRGNAKTLKVRSGTDGLKNIYLDIEDESGNSCSLVFLSDGENAVKLMLNNKVVWTK